MTTLARKLGTTQHLSALLYKAQRLGMPGAGQLMALAVSRGCRHYDGVGLESLSAPAVTREQFSSEELAVALLSPCLPYDPWTLRVGAQMLGDRSCSPRRLAALSQQERAVSVVRKIAFDGRQTEPAEPFWEELLAALPPVSPRHGEPRPGVLPHVSRFRSETGITSPADPVSRGGEMVAWLRPCPASR